MSEVTPRDLDGLAALLAASRTTMGKTKGEKDTEFVKRIVCAYLNAKNEILFRKHEAVMRAFGPE